MHTSIRILRLPFFAIILGLLAAAGGALLMSATAQAEIEGPCSATIAGADVGPLDSESTGDAIDVDEEDVITASMSSSTGFASHKIDLHFLGGVFPARTVEDREDNGETSFTEEVDVSDYAWAGVGLYKVSGIATLTDGTACEGAALVNLTGRNPLTTVAGGVAAGAAAVGTIGGAATGALAATRSPGPLGGYDEVWRGLDSVADARAERQAQDQAARERAERARKREAADTIIDFAGGRGFWSMVFGSIGCLSLLVVALIMTPLMALTGGGGVAGGDEGGGPAGPSEPGETPGPTRLPRAPWLPRVTLLGIVSGLLAGAGLLVLLQQFAVVYPTVGLAIILVAIGAAVYGLVLPTLGYTLAWMRVNRRIAELERSLS